MDGMYLFDFLFTLDAGIFVRIKFLGTSGEFCFTTGKRTTGAKVSELVAHGRTESKVSEVRVLWHAQELYLVCS